MVQIAILNAEFHGINLHHGVPNLANGDCAIEAIADNISTRPEFKEVFNGGSEFNRRVWMSEAENLVLNFSGGAGMTEEEFRAQWDILKHSGNYEYELGDYVLAAIAHCTRKDILIFNTRSDGQYSPIFVVKASSLANRPANTDIPVLLAYNQVHFEGLVPDTSSDLEKTIQLKNQYINGEYSIKKKDIPLFATQQASYAQAVKRAPTAQPTSLFSPSTSIKPTLRPKAPTKVAAQGHSKSRSPPSDSQPHKKIKDMTVEEKRAYKRIKEKQRREKMEESKKGKDERK